MQTFPPTREGFYGSFGGQFIPKSLKPNISRLQNAFDTYAHSASFLDEYNSLLRDYVGRPSPLYRSSFLSDKYGFSVYLKREDLNFTGSHKINNAVGQILLAKHMGCTRIIAETGAGQHGVATATVCALLKMECDIYMGAVDIERQMPNVLRMKMLGANVVPVHQGTSTLADAVDVALETWAKDPEKYFYLLGSAVGPHPYPQMVTHFQSIISEEIRSQLLFHEGTEEPDAVIACIGGGSNAMGAFYHFIDSANVRLIAAEAAGKGVDSGETAASMTLGEEMVLHGARTMVITDGEGTMVEAYSISAGLDYPGVGPLPAAMAAAGRMEVVPVSDDSAVSAAKLLIRGEGIIPAIESSHALAALDLVSGSFGSDSVVVVNLSGRGDKDMKLYLGE